MVYLPIVANANCNCNVTSKSFVCKMFVVQLAVASVIFLALLISNVLTIVLIALFICEDEPSRLQGADYYIVSMAVSDLILAIFFVPFSLVSLSMSQWSFSAEVCEFCAYLWFSLWLINTYNFLLLSTDRRSYVTDKKYRQYTNRVRVRCICEIILAWSMALSFSFAPASNRTHLLTTLLDNQLCIINWPKATGYFATVIAATVVPCLFYSVFNFTKIFYWRIQWKTGRSKTKLSAASVQCLFDPTHVVCLLLYLVFWSSWIPFSINVYRFSSELRSLNVFYFWLGGSQGIWKFPIMIIFCPRYRECICNFSITKAGNNVTPAVTDQNEYNIEISSSPRLQPLSYTVTDDTELHM